MKTKLIILTALLLQGCASLTVHEGAYMSCAVKNEPRDDSPSPIFGGIVTDFCVIGESLSAPFVASGQENIHGWEIALIPFPIIDMPFSFVVDAIYLPSDISYWPEWTESQIKKKHDQEHAQTQE